MNIIEAIDRGVKYKQIIIFFIFIPVMVSSQHINVYFGSADRMKGGIYHAKFDMETGLIEKKNLTTPYSSNFMTFHPNSEILYSASMVDNQAVLVAYKIGPNGQLEELNRIINPAGNAAHLAVHPSGKFLITAHYGAGSTLVFSLNNEGLLHKHVARFEHQPENEEKPINRDGPHPHWTGFSPDGRFAFVPDLGLDEIFIYKISTTEPFLEFHQRAAAPEGSGPRHMRFSVDGKYVFLLNEISLSVTTYKYNSEKGTLQLISTAPTLSDEQKAKHEDNRASEILVHPNGKFIYSANRGDDSITSFEINPKTGHLKVIQVEPIRGDWPRNINMDESGKWLFAAGMRSNTVTIFSIDQLTGKLKFVPGNIHSIPGVRCILTNN